MICYPIMLAVISCLYLFILESSLYNMPTKTPIVAKLQTEIHKQSEAMAHKKSLTSITEDKLYKKLLANGSIKRKSNTLRGLDDYHLYLSTLS